jgi:hypothetical protein
VILPPKKNYIPQFLKQRDINSYYAPEGTAKVLIGGLSPAGKSPPIWDCLIRLTENVL